MVAAEVVVVLVDLLIKEQSVFSISTMSVVLLCVCVCAAVLL